MVENFSGTRGPPCPHLGRWPVSGLPEQSPARAEHWSQFSGQTLQAVQDDQGKSTFFLHFLLAHFWNGAKFWGWGELKPKSTKHISEPRKQFPKPHAACWGIRPGTWNVLAPRSWAGPGRWPWLMATSPVGFLPRTLVLLRTGAEGHRFTPSDQWMFLRFLFLSFLPRAGLPLSRTEAWHLLFLLLPHLGSWEDTELLSTEDIIRGEASKAKLFKASFENLVPEETDVLTGLSGHILA